MLSYKTIIALQILPMLKKCDRKGLTISKLQATIGRQHNLGIRRTLLALTKEGWLVSGLGNSYTIKVDLSRKTLCDLVYVVDGTLQLDTHVRIKQWGVRADHWCPKSMELNVNLSTKLYNELSEIKLSELI